MTNLTEKWKVIIVKLNDFVAEDCLVIKEIKTQQNAMSHNISGSSN